jgi:hypothetical protein
MIRKFGVFFRRITSLTLLTKRPRSAEYRHLITLNIGYSAEVSIAQSKILRSQMYSYRPNGQYPNYEAYVRPAREMSCGANVQRKLLFFIVYLTTLVTTKVLSVGRSQFNVHRQTDPGLRLSVFPGGHPSKY